MTKAIESLFRQESAATEATVESRKRLLFALQGVPPETIGDEVDGDIRRREFGAWAADYVFMAGARSWVVIRFGQLVKLIPDDGAPAPSIKTFRDTLDQKLKEAREAGYLTGELPAADVTIRTQVMGGTEVLGHAEAPSVAATTAEGESVVR